MPRIIARLLVASAMLFLVRAVAAQGNSSLPITESWDLTELKKVGKIVDTRNEAKSKNRVVWILEVKEVPKKLALDVAFYDDEKGRLFTQKEVEFSVVKGSERENPKRIQVIVKLPPANIQKATASVKFRKVED
jgi:hypothetical protein